MTNDDVALTGNIDRESCFLDRWMRISNERKTASTEYLHAKGMCKSQNLRCMYGQNHRLPTCVIGSKFGRSSGLQQCKWSVLIDDR